MRRPEVRRRVGGHTNVTLCASNAKDKKSQNISEIEQKSPVLTRTLSGLRSFAAVGEGPFVDDTYAVGGCSYLVRRASCLGGWVPPSAPPWSGGYGAEAACGAE